MKIVANLTITTTFNKGDVVQNSFGGIGVVFESIDYVPWGKHCIVRMLKGDPYFYPTNTWGDFLSHELTFIR